MEVKKRYWHVACKQCRHRTPYPCKHHGVLVWVTRTGAWTEGGIVFGEFTYGGAFHPMWVWPENAWRYDLVDPDEEG